MKDPRRTSIDTTIARLGPVDEVVADLEKQVRESGHPIGSFIFTPNYLLDKSKLELYQYSELLWIYKKQTRHSVNFIPTQGSRPGPGHSGQRMPLDHRRLLRQAAGLVEQVTPTVRQSVQGEAPEE